MVNSLPLIFLFGVINALFGSVTAATAEQWRGRSIYQVIIDRYALPAGADQNEFDCNVADQTWCGGTWQTLTDNLDYIQGAGFTAVWISPTSQNYNGSRTPYGDAYHGYWVSDVTQLNDKFGTSDDLKALSDELHRRGMYLMVDVVVNDVAVPNTIYPDPTKPDYTDSPFLFKNESQYHPYCAITSNDPTVQQDCWLGDTVVALADVKTEDPTVQAAYSQWIQQLVQDYQIDGLRLDAAINIELGFFGPFCKAAGVFCLGEVYTSDYAQASEYQNPDNLNSMLAYPQYFSLVDTFAIPGNLNTSALVAMVGQGSLFNDSSVLGMFLEDQDVQRWCNLSVDPQSLYNAMVMQHFYAIPVMYYGQEQYFCGGNDPYNREPLWPSGYTETYAYNLSRTFNTLRNYLVNHTDFTLQNFNILNFDAYSVAAQKGNLTFVMTNIGSPPKNYSFPIYTSWPEHETATDIISCTTAVIGSNGTLLNDYSKGGYASVYVLDSTLDITSIGICNQTANSESTYTQSSGERSFISYLHHCSTFVVATVFVLGLIVTNL